MVKRVLDCRASDFKRMNGKDLKQAIKASEGRVIVSEVIERFQPHYPGVTNAEMATAFGADLILLNFFDLFDPCVNGITVDNQLELITSLKKLIGRPIGINLEPVDINSKGLEVLNKISEGRIPTTNSLKEVARFGFDFICLTGNPKTGVSNSEISKAIQLTRSVLGEEMLIFAGKMHSAGVAGESSEGIFSQEGIISFIEAGADVILLPAPGTVPGITIDALQKLISLVHKHGALVMTTIGTSQEGADEQTIRQIAINSKMAGADLHHIGDAGYHGIAIPENILTYSVAIRGKRHTYLRMASSPLR